jgi:hypothetical protein
MLGNVFTDRGLRTPIAAGPRERLAILALAAKESEARVDESLRVLLEKGEGAVRAQAVREAMAGEGMAFASC